MNLETLILDDCIGNDDVVQSLVRFKSATPIKVGIQAG